MDIFLSLGSNQTTHRKNSLCGLYTCYFAASEVRIGAVCALWKFLWVSNNFLSFLSSHLDMFICTLKYSYADMRSAVVYNNSIRLKYMQFKELSHFLSAQKAASLEHNFITKSLIMWFLKLYLLHVLKELYLWLHETLVNLNTRHISCNDRQQRSQLLSALAYQNQSMWGRSVIRSAETHAITDQQNFRCGWSVAYRFPKYFRR